MRKILSVALALVLSFTSAACGGNNSGGSTPDESETIGNNSTNEQTGNPDEVQEENSQNSAVESGQDSTDENESVEDTKIKLIFDNEEVIVNLYDNPMSRDFLTMLPITLSFEDFNGEEKISYLPRKLNTDSTPSNSGPSVGEFAYYAPWGNLAIFYNGPVTTSSNGVIVLGEFESGIEELASMSDDFTMTIEKMD
ncbi:cyclophilin-like fold protein [Paenibacillus sp. BR2-3]|uniref:cyclophilin-like fold protein n=1 Tax=Paenibacillus sp. BR2-3 TaxID=3048494 RepID=UPI0039779B18